MVSEALEIEVMALLRAIKIAQELGYKTRIFEWDAGCSNANKWVAQPTVKVLYH